MPAATRAVAELDEPRRPQRLRDRRRGWQTFRDLHYTADGSGGLLELFVQQGGAATGDSFDLDAVSLTAA